MRDPRFPSRRRASIALAGALVAVVSLAVATVTSATAGAAPIAVSGTASVAIGFTGIDLGVPQPSTFTGNIDDGSGATHLTVANTDLDLSFPLGADIVGFSGTFSNPGGFSGNVSGSTAQLSGTARFKLTGVVIPGLDVPPLLALLPCTLDFVGAFTGTYDAGAGTITAADSAITVPQFPALCAIAIDAALSAAGLDLGINELLAAAPPASATVSLALDTPLATTTSSSSSTSSTTTSTTTSSTTTSSTTTSSTTTSSTTTSSTTTTNTTIPPSTTTSSTTTSSTTTPSTTTPSTTPSSTAPPATSSPPSTVGPVTSGVPTVTRPTTTTPDSSGPTSSSATAPTTTAATHVGADHLPTTSHSTGGNAPAATPVRATPAYIG